MTEDTDGTVLVPVANVETADRLVDTALDIATDRSYGIRITYVLEIPPQIPLSEGDVLLEAEDEAVLEHAESLAESGDVPVESRIRYARDVATGIVGAADECGADLVLMGWRGRPPRRDVVLGSYLDKVLRNAPCDVLVKRIQTPRAEELDSVLVPVAPGAHNRLATELAGSIARTHEATVTLFSVLPEDATDDERETARELLERREETLDSVTVERKLLESDHVSSAVVDETARNDVTVLGASEQSLLRRKLLGTVSEAVGRNAAGTPMIAQSHPSKASREGDTSE